MERKRKAREHSKEYKNQSTLKIHKSKNDLIKKADIHLTPNIPEKFKISAEQEKWILLERSILILAVTLTVMNTIISGSF